MRLLLDFETRSPVDLIGAGAYAYFEHPATQVILAAWAIDDEPFKVWRILRGDPIPLELAYALLDPNTIIVAHNSNFERLACIIAGQHQGFLPSEVWTAIKDPMRWSCTAARAASCGLPRSLENACKALRLLHQKDMDGHRLMLEMCAPRAINPDGTYMWLEDEGRMQRLGEYCIADGLAERGLDHELPDLSPFEQEVYAVTERMNDKGVQVDTDLLLALIILVRDATSYLNQRIVQLTNGQVPAVTNPGAIVKWLKEAHDIDTQDGKIGKWIIAGLLEGPELPDIVREVLVLRRDGGKSSTAKFNTLMKRINQDYRIRGALLYAGAAATSRWSSKGAQLQNLPRITLLKKKLNSAIDAILSKSVTIQDIDKEFGPPMVVASELVRPTFIAPPDHWLARGDYSQIETRVTAWLAGETRLLDAFRAYDTVIGYRENEKGETVPVTAGPDLYVVTAADIYGISQDQIDEYKRQSGKVTILACSFGGGVGALDSMARIYRLQLSDDTKKDAVTKFRDANENIKSFWYALDKAAIECMQDAPGSIHDVRNGVWFRRNEKCMVMHLPSGRHLVYWYPTLELKTMPWLDAYTGEPAQKWCVRYWAEDSQKKIWVQNWAWHGLWCENAVQATARDIMAYALVNLQKKGLSPILTVHDEAVCQIPQSEYADSKDAAQAVLNVMLELPSWAFGLPISAEASAGPRYVKG